MQILKDFMVFCIKIIKCNPIIMKDKANDKRDGGYKAGNGYK